MFSPSGEGLVLDQNGHARYDADECGGPSVRGEVDLEHVGHQKQQHIAHRHVNTWHDRREPARLAELLVASLH